MAEGKKSVVIYTDLIHTVEKLPDDKAGQLFKHFLRYVNDLGPETDDIIINIAFEPIKQQLKRDLKKWDETVSVRSKAGKASAEARRLKKEQELTHSTHVKSVQHNSTHSTDSVNVNVNVNDSVINKKKTECIIPEYKEFETYALSKEPLIDLTSLKFKYEAWIENGWKTGKNVKITNWKSTLLNTIPHINKIEQPKELINDKWKKLQQEEAAAKILANKNKY